MSLEPMYEHAGSLYQNRTEWLRAIVEDFLTSHGSVDAVGVQRVLEENTDDQLARELVENWPPSAAQEVCGVMVRVPDPYTVEELVPVFAAHRDLTWWLTGPSGRYSIHVIGDPDMRSVHRTPIAYASEVEDAADKASERAARYIYGVAVLDTVTGTVDFGTETRPLAEVEMIE